MIRKWSRYRVLEQFMLFPRKLFFVRELSRVTQLAPTAVRTHINALTGEGLIIKEKGGLYPSFRASVENDQFKLLKTQDTLLRLHASGTLEYLQQHTYPTCIVFFGSASRGEDTENSDIDLFVQSKKVEIDLTKFEKKLHRRVNLLFEAKITSLSPELINNLSNGMVVYGYLKVL